MKSTLIRLPGEVNDQLRQLSKAMQMAVTDLLASLINAEAKALGVDLSIPGVIIGNTAEGIVIAIDGHAFKPLSVGEVLEVADDLHAIIGKQRTELSMTPGRNLWFERAGSGFAIVIYTDSSKHRRVFARSVMRAIEDQLRAAAKKRGDWFSSAEKRAAVEGAKDTGALSRRGPKPARSLGPQLGKTVR